MKKKKSLLITIFITCLFTMLGCTIISYFSYSSLNSYAKQELQSISNQIDTLLSGDIEAYEKQLAQHSDHCQNFLAGARELILRTAHLRSITITDDKYILCSTITNNLRLNLPEEMLNSSAEHNHLFYLKNSPLVTGTPVLLFGINSNQYKVMFGIHTQSLTNLLKTENSFFEPKIMIKNKLISSRGLTENSVNNAPNSFQLENQLYKLFYQLTFKNYWHYALLNYVQLYIALIIFAFILSLLLYLLLSKTDWLVFSIHGGLSRSEFQPYIQPIFDQDGQLKGGEVLARWVHHKKGLIGPDSFIPSAEKSGQIVDIFTLLMHSVACKFVPAQAMIPDGFHIAFNVSAPQLITPNLLRDCKQFISCFEQCHQHLAIELTERVEIPDKAEYLDTIDELKKLGVKISLDDFGTGHSSLRYLQKMQIDFLKVDKSFTDMIDNHSDKHHIVENVLDLARRIGVSTIVEGVEKQLQRDYLLARNVSYFQGYYYSQPIPLDEFVALYFKQ